MGELRVLGPEGDQKTIWDPENTDQTEAAEEMYNRLKKKGYTGYHVKKTGGKGKVMDEFDPDAGKVIMVPRIAGG